MRFYEDIVTVHNLKKDDIFVMNGEYYIWVDKSRFRGRCRTVKYRPFGYNYIIECGENTLLADKPQLLYYNGRVVRDLIKGV